MKKIKILAMLVAAMFGTVTIAGAADLTGSIDVTVDEWLGLAYPSISLSNQTVSLGVKRTINGTSGNYTGNVVNDSLVIPLNIVDETGRESYLLPRVIFYMVFITKEEGTLMERLIPMFSFGSANVVSSIIKPDLDANISIKLNYPVNNDTFNGGENSDQGENLTVRVFAMGFLPGAVNGAIEGIPLIAKAEFALEGITYYENEEVIVG
jgi:hypothetical protein